MFDGAFNKTKRIGTNLASATQKQLMKSIVYSILTFSVLFSVSCKSGKKQLNSGNYDVAIAQSVKRLKQNPDHKKADDILASAYKYSLQSHLKMIDQALISGDSLKWDVIAYHYQVLNANGNLIQSCPACMEIIPDASNFQKEESEARAYASAYHIREGIRLMSQKTIMQSRNAYHNFIKAKDFSPGYPGIDDWIFKSREAGTINVQIRMLPMSRNRFAVNGDYFASAILENAKRLNYTFVRFYGEKDNITAPIDEVILLGFDDFVVGETHTKELVEELKRDSVKIGETDVKDGKKPIYGTVKAKLHTFDKTVLSSGLLDLRITNSSDGSLIRQEKIPGTYVWRSNWAYFNGDERALNKEQIELTNRRELPPPSAQDLFILFTGPIVNQTANLIRNQYRGHQ